MISFATIALSSWVAIATYQSQHTEHPKQLEERVAKDYYECERFAKQYWKSYFNGTTNGMYNMEVLCHQVDRPNITKTIRCDYSQNCQIGILYKDYTHN